MQTNAHCRLQPDFGGYPASCSRRSRAGGRFAPIRRGVTARAKGHYQPLKRPKTAELVQRLQIIRCNARCNLQEVTDDDVR